MEDEEFEKYLKRIDEQYRHNAQFVYFRLITLNTFGEVKLKEILEEIYNKGARDAINKKAYEDAVTEEQAKYKLFGY